MIMKFTPYGSPIPLVFAGGKFHPEILMPPPPSGASNKGEVGKQAILALNFNISKKVEDTAKVTINH